MCEIFSWDHFLSVHLTMGHLESMFFVPFWSQGMQWHPRSAMAQKRGHSNIHSWHVNKIQSVTCQILLMKFSNNSFLLSFCEFTCMRGGRAIEKGRVAFCSPVCLQPSWISLTWSSSVWSWPSFIAGFSVGFSTALVGVIYLLLFWWQLLLIFRLNHSLQFNFGSRPHRKPLNGL